MKLDTLADVRAEMGRRRLTQRALAERLDRTEASVSHLMSWEDDIKLSPRGSARFEAALLRNADAEAVQASASSGR